MVTFIYYSFLCRGSPLLILLGIPSGLFIAFLADSVESDYSIDYDKGKDEIYGNIYL